MNRWIFLRHGESEANKARVFSGHQDVGLTPEGRRQAVAAGPLLNTLLDGHHLKTVWSSDLQRARETAERALESASINLPVRQHPALRERCLGDWEGQPIDPIKKSGERRLLLSWEGAAPGGESLCDVALRSVELLKTIDVTGAILVVGHGGLIRALLGLLDGTPREKIGAVDIPNAIPVARDIHAREWVRIHAELSG